MPLTRAAVEADLIDRCGARLAHVGKDATTANGANLSLAGPIADALRALGYDPGYPVADADLEPVPASQAGKLLDYTEYYTLWRILNNWAEVDYGAGNVNESLDQFARQVKDALEMLEARMTKQYGPLGVAAIGAAGGRMISGYDPGGGGLRRGCGANAEVPVGGWCAPLGWDPWCGYGPGGIP